MAAIRDERVTCFLLCGVTVHMNIDLSPHALHAVQAAEQGKRAEQLARSLPDHLRGALGYEVPQGPK